MVERLMQHQVLNLRQLLFFHSLYTLYYSMSIIYECNRIQHIVAEYVTVFLENDC